MALPGCGDVEDGDLQRAEGGVFGGVPRVRRARSAREGVSLDGAAAERLFWNARRGAENSAAARGNLLGVGGSQFNGGAFNNTPDRISQIAEMGESRGSANSRA